MTKEEIRQKAAIAVLPMCVGDVQESVLRGLNFDKKAIDKAVVTAVAYADAIVEKLKVHEQETEQKFNAEKIVKILKEQVGFDPEIHKIIDEHYDEMLGEEPVNLSNVEQNGKKCKPANFAKSCKDLQETPEKIYVHIPDDDIVGTASIQKGFPHEFVTKEYIRTDVFMEKVFCWFKENYEDIGIRWMRGDNADIWFDDLKKIMKGK